MATLSPECVVIVGTVYCGSQTKFGFALYSLRELFVSRFVLRNNLPCYSYSTTHLFGHLFCASTGHSTLELSLVLYWIQKNQVIQRNATIRHIRMHNGTEHQPSSLINVREVVWRRKNLDKNYNSVKITFIAEIYIGNVLADFINIILEKCLK